MHNIYQFSAFRNDLQVLNKCQLGDEASKKEGKLDSLGRFHKPLQIYFFQFVRKNII